MPKLKPAESRVEQVYEYIKKYRAENGYSPSIREITYGCNIPSTSMTASYIRKLMDTGRISKMGNRARSIVVIK